MPSDQRGPTILYQSGGVVRKTPQLIQYSGPGLDSSNGGLEHKVQYTSDV